MYAALTPPYPARAGSANASMPFAFVEAHSEVDGVEAAWAELELAAPCSIYQTRRFLQPWSRTLGARHGMRPGYVLARDSKGFPVALLCLGLTRHGPLTIARPLGGKDANLHMPLLRSVDDWGRRAVRSFLREAARMLAADLFVFPNQVHRLAGEVNAFVDLPHVASPSAAYGTDLPAAAESLFAARFSKEARKKLRSKAAKLATLGRVSHRIARDPTEIALVADVLLAQKTARFGDRGIAGRFADPAMRAFLAEAAAHERGLELHALLVDERIVATYCGGAHQGRWSAMMNSFAADDEAVARCSPGDLLLMRIVEGCCARGLSSFDLGIGEARYKAALCSAAIPLFDAAIGFGPLGRAAAATLLARQAAKRRIKGNPRLLAAARRLAFLRRSYRR